MGQVLQRSAAMAGKVLAMIACAALFVVMVLTFVDVIGRYGFNNSIFGVSEMVELLMVALIFGGFAFVTASGGHVCVSLADDLLRARAPVVMCAANVLVSLSVYLIFLWVFWGMAVNALTAGDETIVLGLPLWLFPGTAAVMSTLGIILFAAPKLPLHPKEGGTRHE